MQRTEERAEMGGLERKRVEAVVETLATLGCQGETVAEVAHDARNMVTALGLYCDLLEEPGVLATPFAHYGNELRLVAAASRRLVEKLVTLDAGREMNSSSGLKAGVNADLNAGLKTRGLNAGMNAQLGAGSEASDDASSNTHPDAGVAERGRAAGRILAATGQSFTTAALGGRTERRVSEIRGRWDLMPAAPIENLAAEMLANHNLLAALAGPAIALTVDVEGAARPVRMTGEDLTRVLVNLVKNAAEALPGGGHIQIELGELPAEAGAMEALALTIEDDGPGIQEHAKEEIFAAGYTTRRKGAELKGSWPVIHRGLGLSITRSIVEASGGRITVGNRAQGGARFAVELPVRRV